MPADTPPLRPHQPETACLAGLARLLLAVAARRRERQQTQPADRQPEKGGRPA
jgi:hypothetical protein